MDQTIYVIGHKSPDADSVGSAMAYAQLLRAQGLPARAAVSAQPNNETRCALESFGLETPMVLDRAEGRRFVLVDHSDYAQAVDGMADAEILEIVDHHELGNAAGESVRTCCARVGATATLVYEAYKERSIDIPRDMARVMLMGLLSDTAGGTQKMTGRDDAALAALRCLAELDADALYRRMHEAAQSYEGMSDREVFLSDYKEYLLSGKKVGMASLTAADRPCALALAGRMRAFMKTNLKPLGTDMLYVKIAVGDPDGPETVKAYMLAWGAGAAEVLEGIYHNDNGEGLFSFRENVSRKLDVIPAVSRALTERA